MSFSKETLKIIDLLGSLGFPLDSAALKTYVPFDEVVDPDRAAEYERYPQLITGIAKSAVDAKRGPAPVARPHADDLIKAVSAVHGDDILDEYLARTALSMVPRFASRVRKLQAIRFARVPGSAVTRYYDQAAGCYIYGFFAAVAILSRAVIESALEESCPLKPSQFRDRGHLELLIKCAGTTRVLNSDLVGRAHAVRIAGNNGVHGKHVGEDDARKTIADALAVLHGIYGSR
jgi:hypothetical protein